MAVEGRLFGIAKAPSSSSEALTLPPSAGWERALHLPRLELECSGTRTPRSSSTSFLDFGVWLPPPPALVRVNNQELPDGGLIHPKKGLMSRFLVGIP